MRITPEQVRNQEFPVRLKGYDPEEVRGFLEEVAAAYRATIRDEGAEWALRNISDDLASVLRAAHSTAEQVLSQAETEAHELRARAEAEAAGVRTDADEYATRTRTDADEYAAEQWHRADEDRTQARRLLERTEEHVSEVEAEARDKAATITRAAERDARSRVDRLEHHTARQTAAAEDEAWERVEAILDEGRRRLEELQEAEHELRTRILDAQGQFEETVQRLIGQHEATIDLTGTDAVVRFEGADGDGRPSLEEFSEMVRELVDSAVQNTPAPRAGGSRAPSE